jgi:hypothetical protein
MKGTRIQFIFSWLRGIHMDVPCSKYVMFSIGTAIMLYSLSNFISEILFALSSAGLL